MREPRCCRIAADSSRLHGIVQLIFSAASLVHQITATNVRRIAPVDHSRGGVFLFNYFFADSVDQNLSVWNYTAGWFQAETGLDNSTVLLPIDPQINRNTASSTIAAGTRSVKYCHPSFSERSFRSYVLDNFAANNIAAMPILYRWA